MFLTSNDLEVKSIDILECLNIRILVEDESVGL